MCQFSIYFNSKKIVLNSIEDFLASLLSAPEFKNLFMSRPNDTTFSYSRLTSFDFGQNWKFALTSFNLL